MIKLLKYIFFAAYWTALDLGEKSTPQINAEYLTGFIIAQNILGFIEILNFLGVKVDSSIVVIEFILSYLLVYLIFIKKKRFKRDLINYKYLSLIENKFRRNTILILLVVWSILFVAFGAIIR